MRSIDYQPGSLYTVRGRRKYLSADERARFIEATNRCSRAEIGTLCLTLAYTGCRISEALALTNSSVDLETGFIAIRSLKKRSRAVIVREIPIPSHLVTILELTHGISCGDPDARIWNLSRSRAWRLIKELMKEAGIAPGTHATPKGLRHGFGLHAIRSGVPLNLVQRWLGHARMETTAIYLQAMGSEEREIAERMWAQ
ncbi:MAG: tyrosine-type recombinase/integrase [Rhodopseudomonas sp.]|nr:tyrosine-type recombinase/integrase [Rhodopseudomonas sp.]